MKSTIRQRAERLAIALNNVSVDGWPDLIELALHRERAIALHSDGRDLQAEPEPMVPYKIEDDKSLPLPRLELVWKPGSLADDPWHERFVEYRMVAMHLLDYVVAIPLGLTRITGGHVGDRPWERYDSRGREYIDIPFRDGAHAVHDSMHLRMPLYTVTPDGAKLFERHKDYPSQSHLGTEHRRA